ncbi:MAG: HAD-IB family phosphatase, partial [SAR324 cluster bacterium]|nr:HAD-IB family phosphatase [SAR324 cluster bacterium]
MNLALFDLDNTLLDGDSETLWFEYLHQAGHLEGNFFGKLEEFTNDYDQEELDFSEYLNFILLPLKKWGPEKVNPWREQFLLEKIQPRLRYQNILHDHRRQGDVLVLITASHDFLAEPIGQMLEMDFTLSTRPEIIDEIYTGKVREACFRE